MIIKADGDVEYPVPDDIITPELLEGGSFLKRAIGICNRNRTRLNMIKLMKNLRDSLIWIPCSAVMSDADYAALEKVRGIVINAFSEPFVIPVELFDLIAEMPSSFEMKEEAENE